MKKKSVLLNRTISAMISGLSVSRNGRKMCYCSSILLGHCYTLEQNKKQEVSMPSHPCNDNFSHVGTWKIDVPTCSIVMSIESCFFFLNPPVPLIPTNLIKKVSYSLIKFQLSLPELWLEEGTLEDYHVICI